MVDFILFSLSLGLVVWLSLAKEIFENVVPAGTRKVLSHCTTGLALFCYAWNAETLALFCCSWNAETVIQRKQAHPLERPCGDRQKARKSLTESVQSRRTTLTSHRILRNHKPQLFKTPRLVWFVKQRRLPYRGAIPPQSADVLWPWPDNPHLNT